MNNLIQSAAIKYLKPKYSYSRHLLPNIMVSVSFIMCGLLITHSRVGVNLQYSVPEKY